MNSPLHDKLARYKAALVARRYEAVAQLDEWIERRLLTRLTARLLPLPAEVRNWKVVFIGASVGSAWRLDLVYPNIRTYAAYQFDKTALVEQAIAERPDAILLKECAAYFPAGGEDRRAFRSWVDRIILAGIAPIIATVVPVTAQHEQLHHGRSRAIAAFNDWLRELAEAKGLPLLDLEQALRPSASSRQLVEGLDSGDGLHLRRQTYRQTLDHLIPLALMEGWAYQQRRFAG